MKLVLILITLVSALLAIDNGINSGLIEVIDGKHSTDNTKITLVNNVLYFAYSNAGDMTKVLSSAKNKDTVRKIFNKNVCSDPTLKDAINNNITITYLYLSKDSKNIGVVTIDHCY